jgi:hypothetical protein
MDLYTLSETFLAKDVVDEYVSAIWTERYSSAGDMRLVVSATTRNLEKLKEGTFLALRGSKEVMQIDTVSIEDGLMTCVGESLTKYLNQRYAWFRNIASTAAAERVVDYKSDDVSAGEFIANVVNLIAIDPVYFEDLWDPANLNWDEDIIPGLTLGPVDTTGEVKELTAAIGPLYDSIQQVAEKEGVGIKLYLEDADPITGFSLKFTTYRGKDHTTDGAFPLVRLTPALDSLSEVKELRSIANWKNVAYVYYAGIISMHYEDPDSPPVGFERRVLITDAEKQPVGHKEPNPYYQQMGGLPFYTVVSPADVTAFREQNARDALANHNYIRAIDGQTSPANDYQYGVHYDLGDIIELEGLTGNISKARITEFIRSQDQEGAKEYPTISVLQPTESEG